MRDYKEEFDKRVAWIRQLVEGAGCKGIIYGNSGGKDSDVILELAKMAKIPFTAIYKNTTIDPPGTIKHCLDNGVQIVQPKTSFFHLIDKSGFPSRRFRFCCSVLKEYKIKDAAILGIRREESMRRAKNYTEPEQCRVYSKNEKQHQIYPILYWTQEDVQQFIQERGIKLHPLYYREDGSLDCSRRLGCLGCPLKSDHGIAEFKENPKILRQWIRHGKIWWDTHPDVKVRKIFSDVYELFARRTFNDTFAGVVLNKEAMFKTDYKEVLENYFNIELP